jgi:hypothetical protein
MFINNSRLGTSISRRFLERMKFVLLIAATAFIASSPLTAATIPITEATNTLPAPAGVPIFVPLGAGQVVTAGVVFLCEGVATPAGCVATTAGKSGQSDAVWFLPTPAGAAAPGINITMLSNCDEIISDGKADQCGAGALWSPITGLFSPIPGAPAAPATEYVNEITTDIVKGTIGNNYIPTAAAQPGWITGLAAGVAQNEYDIVSNCSSDDTCALPIPEAQTLQITALGVLGFLVLGRSKDRSDSDVRGSSLEARD